MSLPERTGPCRRASGHHTAMTAPSVINVKMGHRIIKSLYGALPEQPCLHRRAAAIPGGRARASMYIRRRSNGAPNSNLLPFCSDNITTCDRPTDHLNVAVGVVACQCLVIGNLRLGPASDTYKAASSRYSSWSRRRAPRQPSSAVGKPGVKPDAPPAPADERQKQRVSSRIH